ncbi:uncharacterized protein LOC110718930 [Chenopodium quinoa]|uniref:uncharacterized protein LOC110718930 n=1 Tax=Chenopodium quinoa TaxID=63459 RepID=UPI000B79483B|nr:uncharacterized protein LOC110718930 [Chenopodium quinoa]
MGNKEPEPTTTQRRGRGWGWGWSRGEGAGSPQGQGGWPAPAGYNFSRSGYPLSRRNRTNGPNRIIVGGSNNWSFGFNYCDWAFKIGPYYLNDVLVFKYSAPVNETPGHSIYLLPDFWS